MGATAPIPKKDGHTMPIQNPSFVYRQDGYELSYKISLIIAVYPRIVKALQRFDGSGQRLCNILCRHILYVVKQHALTQKLWQCV